MQNCDSHPADVVIVVVIDVVVVADPFELAVDCWLHELINVFNKIKWDCSHETPKTTNAGQRTLKLKEVRSSVTRFGKSLQIFDGLFLIWQNAETTLAHLRHNEANFHCCKWPNIEKN